MKKLLHIILVPIIIIIIVIIYMSYLSSSNQNYLDSITKDIKDNYKVEEEITYSNQYGNYYILTTKTSVIVLNKQYKEVLSENISTIKIKEDMELIYKTNKLMYEEKKIINKVLTYKYYDATTGEFIKETTMELK